MPRIQKSGMNPLAQPKPSKSKSSKGVQKRHCMVSTLRACCQSSAMISAESLREAPTFRHSQVIGIDAWTATSRLPRGKQLDAERSSSLGETLDHGLLKLVHTCKVCASFWVPAWWIFVSSAENNDLQGVTQPKVVDITASDFSAFTPEIDSSQTLHATVSDLVGNDRMNTSSPARL